MDPYFYPGTNVLKDVRYIRDPELLAKFEMDRATRRLAELAVTPISAQFDTQHLQAIHYHLFKDVYSWAGKLRTVEISKSGSLFALPQHITTSLDRALEDLQKEDYLRGLDLKGFANRGAYYLGELNAVHPFREGNGRAQREFMGTRRL